VRSGDLETIQQTVDFLGINRIRQTNTGLTTSPDFEG
jgi:hypothetical protein